MMMMMRVMMVMVMTVVMTVMVVMIVLVWNLTCQGVTTSHLHSNMHTLMLLAFSSDENGAATLRWLVDVLDVCLGCVLCFSVWDIAI